MGAFTDRVAIVTGAASGIGLATCRRLAADRARVALVDVDPAKLDLAVEQVQSDGAAAAIPCRCDVSQDDQVAATVASVLERFGGLDLVVNNAGVMVFKPLEEQTREDWLRVLSIDLLGAFFFTREAFLHMKPGGVIVNVSSIHAVETTPLVVSYAAAKSALVSLTRSAALEGKDKGIRVNAVLPGAVDTPMLWENPNVKSGLETIQTSDVGKPEDIANAILFLASGESEFVRGSTLRVDGGRLSRL